MTVFMMACKKQTMNFWSLKQNFIYVLHVPEIKFNDRSSIDVPKFLQAANGSFNLNTD